MIDLHGRLYFRTRDNGAAVFRIDTQNKSRRLDMKQIASVAIRKSEIRPQGEVEITDAERIEIKEWITARQTELKTRKKDDVERLIDAMKHTIHWIVSDAESSEIEPISEELLLTIHDLRSVLVRKLADNLDDK